MLQILNYPNPYSATPIPVAVAWISSLGVDFVGGQGRIGVFVHVDAASAVAGLPPIDSFGVSLGERYPTGGSFPDLTGIVTNAAIDAASDNTLTPFDAIRKAIYEALLNHPRLSGASSI